MALEEKDAELAKLIYETLCDQRVNMSAPYAHVENLHFEPYTFVTLDGDFDLLAVARRVQQLFARENRHA